MKLWINLTRDPSLAGRRHVVILYKSSTRGGAKNKNNRDRERQSGSESGVAIQ
jgi:hypothetical protein